MTVKSKVAFDIQTFSARGHPPGPGADAVAGTAALAVTTALLRALKERGLLAPGELDEIIANAHFKLRDAAARRLLDGVRYELDHAEAE
jgi:hypothetical protein